MCEGPLARGFVLIAGPDGVGKSTVVHAIVDAATSAGIRVSRAHYRPGILGGRASGAPVTDPHAKPPRSAIASLVKLAVLFLDHVVGGRTTWRAQRRQGLLLLERGWFDMAVDPRRYRLPARMVPLVRILGRLLPLPDLVLLLAGEATAIHLRKPEIGSAEVDRQIRRWREIGLSAGGRVLEMDTVRTSPEQVAAMALEVLTPAIPGDSTRRWRSIPLTPPRLALCTTGRARPALAIYQPQSLRARVGMAVARRSIAVPSRHVPEPFADLDDLWTVLGVVPEGVAVMRSSTPGRAVLSVCRDGRMDIVVKIGVLNDAALRNEAVMLSAPLQSAVGRPDVTWSGDWQNRFVLATRAAQRSCNARWTPLDVIPLAEALAAAGPGGAALTHGDLTPWNLVRTSEGPVLLDWESARWSDEPLHDLAHFVVQNGALLRRYPPKEAVSLLCDDYSPGVRLLRTRGRDATEARSLLVRYLDQARPTVPRAVRFRAEMMRLVSV